METGAETPAAVKSETNAPGVLGAHRNHQTGDTFDMALHEAGIGIGLAGIAALAMGKRKKKSENSDEE